MELGLYEQVINEDLDHDLRLLPDDLTATTRDIDKAEASGILAAYLAQQAAILLEQAEEQGLDEQIQIVNRMLSAARDQAKGDHVASPGKQLLSLHDARQDIIKRSKSTPTRPETSLSQSSLFTGSHHEPQLYTELAKEIDSCDRIEMLVSFIRWSGLRLIIDHLRTFTERGGQLRVITTTYIGATDAKAIDELAGLPHTQVKVSYDSTHTRLHAKAYLFHRDTGYTTAYVGSSNISRPAITEGLEWNMKITLQDQPSVIAKMQATFDSYWESEEYELYDHSKHQQLIDAIERERHPKATSVDLNQLSHFLDVRAYPYQQEILDQLRAEREVKEHWHNLVVAATGTGKTVISALDYRDWCRRYAGGRRAKLLFVAHRKEILQQSIACFRDVLKDPNFGSLMVGEYSPDSLEHLFVSVQSLNSRNMVESLPADYYDYIVVDEFHHAAAS